MSLNKVLLIGYVGADPDIRYYNDKQSVAAFSLALKRPAFKTKSGNISPEQTDWIRISAFGDAAILAEEYVRKGTRLLVEGRLSTRSYTDKRGVAHNITEVVAEKLTLLDAARGAKSAETARADSLNRTPN